MSALFSPFSLKDVTLRNRIAVPPMCQYMATDGVVNDWHRVHYPALARGGAGLVIVEATAVSPEGRITPGCLGLWNDAQAEAWRRSPLDQGRGRGARHPDRPRRPQGQRQPPVGGRRPHRRRRCARLGTLSPSATAFGANLPKVPREMTVDDIARVRADFVAAARRAREAGFEWLEVGRDFAPAGDLLSCFAKKEGKEGDPATPGRPAADCPALLPAGGRRGTRPSGSDSRAGLPRLLVRCSAGRNGLFGCTEPLRNLSRALAVDHLHFLSPLACRLEVMTGGKRASHV
jgi:hypothetical protein